MNVLPTKAILGKTFLCALTLGMACAFAPARAADKGTADEAVAMVKKAVALIKAKGKPAAFAEFADPANRDFHYLDLYVYAYDLNGMTLAHGNNPKMVGKNLIELKDADQKPIMKLMVELAKSPAGKGWVDFKWPNPVSHAMEPKSGYIERIDDMLVGSGIYK